jgi:hypothetical protein
VLEVVGCDATCWHTISDAGVLILASEYVVEDVNTFAGLAARRVPVGILSRGRCWERFTSPAGRQT